MGNIRNSHKTSRDITEDHATAPERHTPRAQYREDSRNYRKHSKRNLDLISRSLAENGAGRSILLDNTGESIAGSGTLNRAQKLGVPIRGIHTDGSELIAVIRDDIGPDDPRRKRLALADNACSDSSEWDFDAIEADAWEPEELADWGIDLPPEPAPEKSDAGYYGDKREDTFNKYNLHEFDPFRCAGFYQMPTLEPETHVPERLIDFNAAKSSKEHHAGVHFFIDDYRFECIWSRPHEYVDRLCFFDCAFTPDFSLYLDMPMAMKVWNVYRSRLIGQIMQDAGIRVIPTVSWAEPETYRFCFDGLPEGGNVAVSTVGVMRDKAAQRIFRDGMAAMIEKVKPALILMYGKPMPEACGDVPFRSYENDTFGAQFAARAKSRKEK
ncbi:DUF4417 domain-containing protein [Victivallis vadensis]|uniref:DUF4417 domain-containing protein n=1 Tax=Victivallis vadensis TaxID=172901 RepID=UPI00266D7A17|nr:DUF4417 domain-containing protein [Victivallis vadensis]